MSVDIREIIDDSPLFKHLSEQWRRDIADASEVYDFEDGEPLIREGQSQKHGVFVLLSGRARVWTENQGEPVDLKTLQPGAYFGEVGLLSGGRASATVEAASPELRVLAIDQPILETLIDEDERVRRMLKKVTEARAQQAAGKMKHDQS